MSARLGSKAIACALFALTAACGDDGATDMPASMAQPLTCTAGQPRPCPCVGQGMGMQMCNATGNGYGACTGCPAAAGQGGAASAGSGGARAGTGGTAAAPGGAGGSSGSGSSAGAGAGGSAGAGGAGGRSGSGGAGGAHEPSPTAAAEPGVSCGVGLPVLCALETEKCCVRSLQTDSCIEATAMCSCSLQGCTVMEARCDGPEDCPSGQVCCGTLAGNSYMQFVCAASCQSNGQQRVACHASDPKCPSNLICANSQLLTNVQVCIDPASIEQ